MKTILLASLLVSSVSAMAASKPCGLKGDANNRITDCSVQNDSVKGGFVLMTRTQDNKEFYVEVDTKKVWSSNIKGSCDTYMPFTDLNLQWSLPSKESFQIAENNGIRQAFGDFHGSTWTSTRQSFPTRAIWVFKETGKFGVIGVQAASRAYLSTRCSARL